MSARRAYALPALLFFASILQVTDNQVLPVLLPFLGTWAGAPREHLLMAYAIGAAFGPLLVAGLMPRLSGRSALLASLLALAACQAAFAMEPGFETAIAVRALSGAASGVLSYAQLSVAVQAGNLALTSMTAGFLAAMVIGVPGSAEIFSGSGLPAVYFTLAAIAAVTALLSAVVVRAGPAAALTDPRGFLSFLASRRYRDAIIASVVIAMAVGGAVALFPGALKERAGVTIDQTKWIYFTASAGPVLAAFVGVYALRRHGKRALAIIGSVALAPLIAVLPFVADNLLLAAAILTAALHLETVRRSALQGIVASLVSESERPRYLALRGCAVQVGIAAGVAVAFRTGKSFGFPAAFGMAAALSAASALFIPRSGVAATPAAEPVGAASGTARSA